MPYRRQVNTIVSSLIPIPSSVEIHTRFTLIKKYALRRRPSQRGEHPRRSGSPVPDNYHIYSNIPLCRYVSGRGHPDLQKYANSTSKSCQSNEVINPLSRANSITPREPITLRPLSFAKSF